MENVIERRDCKDAKQATVTKQAEYCINVEGDGPTCWVTGIAITQDNKKIVVDHRNNKMKLFSVEMEFLSSLSVPTIPWDIAILSDREAVVTTANREIVKLDISGKQLSVKDILQLDYSMHGIVSYRNKLIVTCPYTNPPSVKMIDFERKGEICWSTSVDHQGCRLFEFPEYVCRGKMDGKTVIAVTDGRTNTLTLLNTDTGKVISTRQLKAKAIRGITSDPSGNFYISCYWTGDVSIVSANSFEETILISKPDFYAKLPWTLDYDDTSDLLIVSYHNSNTIISYDCS